MTDDAAAQSLLEHTAPDRVVVFKTRACAYCVAAARYLREAKGATVVEVDLTGDYDARRALAELTGQQTVPQIYVGTHHIGGYDELRSLDRRGGLAPLLDAVTSAKL